MDIRELIEKAFEAREYSHCPYSGFAVGAALLCRDGAVYTGCNIESASFSPTNCAERTALFKAVSEGRRDFSALAVAGGPRKDGPGQIDFCPPCGVCRQVLAEFCGPDFQVIMARSPEDYTISAMAELLPMSFGPQTVAGGGAAE